MVYICECVVVCSVMFKSLQRTIGSIARSNEWKQCLLPRKFEMTLKEFSIVEVTIRNWLIARAKVLIAGLE